MIAPFRFCADSIYRCEAFEPFRWLEHGFGTRLANPDGGITLKQIHSNLVFDARALSDRSCEGDALISNEAGTSIGVRTADCVPLLLVDERNRVVSAIHAGWRGTVAGIVTRAIQQMGAFYETKPDNVTAAIGPCIQACCYEVGAEVSSRFRSLFPGMREGREKHMLDLAEANTRLLRAAGVRADRIFNSDLCTQCNAEHFFSYRREPGNPGRMVSSIARVA